jgi:hypothetical protein
MSVLLLTYFNTPYKGFKHFWRIVRAERTFKQHFHMTSLQVAAKALKKPHILDQSISLHNLSLKSNAKMANAPCNYSSSSVLHYAKGIRRST